jgi:hypothetical protein
MDTVKKCFWRSGKIHYLPLLINIRGSFGIIHIAVIAHKIDLISFIHTVHPFIDQVGFFKKATRWGVHRVTESRVGRETQCVFGRK